MTDELSEAQPVAIFDFDGTITSKSTTVPFLKHLHGSLFYAKLISRLHSLMLYYSGITDINALNRQIAQAFFLNLSRHYLFQEGATFSEKIIPGLVRESAAKRLQWHKNQGHACFLATSAYDVYVDHWAKKNGFDEVVSTKIAFDEQGLANGTLNGKSCYGEEKLKRILELIGNKPRTIYAYGDSVGDQAMLDYATYPYYKYFN